ncbi:all3515 family Zur-repressed PEP-CTERM protein [Brasilonema sennae]|uniref:all3515 family Zur-repressed PEP-CTERM protein n=1 Tax=Brasilonema sennae TaxID=1397703 RepID=UPI001FE2975A|nr:all3515 family Zur-repressed PEP-CTERM protein [Brasilonema sennae]
MIASNKTCFLKQKTQTGKAFASIAVSFLVTTPLVLSTALTSAQADEGHTHTDETEYFVGLDTLQVLTSGTYAGLENPNYNRLTFLYAHREENPTTNHFHGIGAYSYSGSKDSPTITSTNTNNRIPEPYTQQSPLTLLPGTGVFSGRLVSTPTNEEYSNLKTQPVLSLKNSTESEDQYLFNSSNRRWQGSLQGATTGLQLVSISDGLNVTDKSGSNLFNSVGDIYTVGSSDNFYFNPTFWTNATAPLGTYSATFKLIDNGTTNNRTALGESGTFSFDFKVEKVPEPTTTIGLGVLGVVALSLSRQRKRIGNERMN